MDLMQRRRELLAQKSGPSELYPVGTDICDYYNLKSTAVSNVGLNTDTGGLIEVTSTSYWTSANYAEIDPTYTYVKKQYRLYRICYYDSDYNYISFTDSLNDTTIGQVLNNIPTNARYVRIAMYASSSGPSSNVGLVRNA